MFRNPKAGNNVKGHSNMSDDSSADEYDWDVTFDPPPIPPIQSYFTPVLYSDQPQVSSSPPPGRPAGQPGHFQRTPTAGDAESDHEEESAYDWRSSPVYSGIDKYKGSPKRRRRFHGIFAPSGNERNGQSESPAGQTSPVPFGSFRTTSNSESSESSALTEYFSLDMDMEDPTEEAMDVTDIVATASLHQAMSSHQEGVKLCPCCNQVVSAGTQLAQVDTLSPSLESKDQSTSMIQSEDSLEGKSSLHFLYRHPVGRVMGHSSENEFESFPFVGMKDQSTSTLTLDYDIDYDLTRKTIEKLEAMTELLVSEEQSMDMSHEGEEDDLDDLSEDEEIIELVDRSTSTPSIPSKPEWVVHVSTSTSTLSPTDSKEAQVQTSEVNLELRCQSANGQSTQPSNANGHVDPVHVVKEKLPSGIPRCIKGVTPPPPPASNVQSPSRIPRKVAPVDRLPSLIPKPGKRGTFCGPTTLRIEK